MSQLAPRLRTLAPVLVFLLALLCGPAWAGDPKSAQRYLDSAKGDLQNQRWDQVESYLQRAEQQLEGVDAATAAPIKKEIEQVRAAAKEGKRQYEAGRIMEGALNRAISSAEGQLNRFGDSTGRVKVVDEAKARFYEQVVKPGILDAAQAKELEKRWADMRAQAVKDDIDAGFRAVEKPLGKAEEMLKNGGTYFENIDQQLEYATKELAEAEKQDPRFAAMTARVNKAKAELARQREQAQHDEVVGAALKGWAYRKENNASEREGFEEEPLHTYEQWRKTNSDIMPKCAAAHRMAHDWLDDDRAKTALRAYPKDAELLKAKAEADAILQKSAERYTAAIKNITEEGQNHTKEQPKDFVQSLGYLRSNVDRQLSDGAQKTEALAAVQGLIDKIEAEMAEAKANKEALTQTCVDAANEVWPDMQGDFSGFVDMDPTECVEDIDAWKGKLVHLENPTDRAGWEYTRGDNALVTPINGVPVAFMYDDGLWAAIQKMEEATGLEMGDFQDVIAVVEGTCKVQESEWSSALNDWFPKYMHTAPRCRILAFRAGPFAASLASGTTNLEEVPDMPSIEVKAKGAVPGGGGGFFMGLIKLVFGLGCCVIFLGALGGGGYFVYMQQQKAAAEKAVAAGGDGKAPPAPAPVAPPMAAPAAPIPPMPAPPAAPQAPGAPPPSGMGAVPPPPPSGMGEIGRAHV